MLTLCSKDVELRQRKSLNNMVEPNYRFFKKWVRLMLGFQSLQTATKPLASIEAMYMIKKDRLSKGKVCLKSDPADS